MENIDLLKRTSELEKEKEDLLKKHFEKYNFIRQKIEFFCKKHNANFSSNLRDFFEFKDRYKKEAFNTFYTYMYNDNADFDNLKKVFHKKTIGIALAKYDKWKEKQLKDQKYMAGYDFDEELKEFNNMMDMFKLFVELIVLLYEYKDTYSEILGNFSVETF